jgi:hypothetical protein
LCNSPSQNLENANLASQPELEVLDLSRNSIANIGPGTFLGLGQLHKLDLSVNALRTVSLCGPLIAAETESGYDLRYLQRVPLVANQILHQRDSRPLISMKL